MHLNFHLFINYFNNTNYNEVDFLKYANSPIHEGLKKIEEFSIIRQGDKYYQNYPIKEKEVIKFEHKIENLIVAHNKIILSYVDKGSIILYDIESNKQNEIEAHNGRIISITKINDNSFKIHTNKESIQEIIKKLIENGVKIYTVKEEEISLEDAFLKRTGGNIID